ncbi:hypothetical protein [Streptomyces sp. CB01249]|uniref:hypothetical protein n=1 Tax=Streptomyces sp. CB01249 TaxID=1703929 RepID=UPI0018E9261A
MYAALIRRTALTTGQYLRWSRCTSPPAAREGYDCAVMKTPLDYRKPDGRTIDVALIRLEATGPNSRRIGSLVLNFGGPGVSGVSGLPARLRQYGPLRDRYDLVSFDPRGVGRTSAAHIRDCPTGDGPEEAARGWRGWPTAWRGSPPRPEAAGPSTPTTSRTTSATISPAARTGGSPSPRRSPR